MYFHILRNVFSHFKKSKISEQIQLSPVVPNLAVGAGCPVPPGHVAEAVAVQGGEGGELEGAGGEGAGVGAGQVRHAPGSGGGGRLEGAGRQARRDPGVVVVV